MKILKPVLLVLLAVGLMVLPNYIFSQELDIVDTAASIDRFSTLVAAVGAADLVDVLKSEGPFTVFAPNDDAFAKLPAGTLDSLLLPENKNQLINILTYHVVPGRLLAADVIGLTNAKSATANQQLVSFSIVESQAKVDNANIITTDVLTTNGVIHEIDSVIFPAERNDIVDTAVGAGTFNTLVAAVEAAGLVDTLKGEDLLTVFAPTDEAFAKLPDGTVESLLLPENIDQLVAILTYHVVAGKVIASEVVNLDSATTLNGASINVEVVEGAVTLNSANVTAVDIDTSNGVIHVIDAVLLPPSNVTNFDLY